MHRTLFAFCLTLAACAPGRSSLQEQGFEHVEVEWDGRFTGWKEGRYCEGTVTVTPFGSASRWSCGGTPKTCHPWLPASCALEAVATRASDPARSATLLATACLHGRVTSCGGWEDTSLDELLRLEPALALGCARGRQGACMRLGYVDRKLGRFDSAVARSERACEADVAQGCVNAAVLHRQLGRPEQATRWQELACARWPEHASCLPDES